MRAPTIYAIATMDSKGEELAYLASRITRCGADVKKIDVGTLDAATVVPDVSREEVLAGATLPTDGDRGNAVTAMSKALTRFLLSHQSQYLGVIGIGGSGGTALITAAMRELPVGLPKLMVSTVASGNVAPYVDCSDITMMYSVVDVAGINVVSKRVLGNAAAAIAGMCCAVPDPDPPKPTVGMTMFGVTTPCVTNVRKQLEAKGSDCLVFHATGSGGRAMEKLVQSKMIGGVLDITTTEVADEIVGGIFPAGPKRFEKLIHAEIPLVLSLGAVDMVNFGGRETVPALFQNRNLHVHNAQVTLMRTNIDENEQIARWIAAKLNQSKSPVTILVPEGGVSMLDAPGQPFYDPEANQALFSELERRLQINEQRRFVRLPHHINDDAFANALVSEFSLLQG